MLAAWYERGGPAREVLTVGEMDAPRPGPGEVLVRLRASGINSGEIKKRADWMGFGIGYPRVIPTATARGRSRRLARASRPRASARGCGCGARRAGGPSVPPPSTLPFPKRRP